MNNSNLQLLSLKYLKEKNNLVIKYFIGYEMLIICVAILFLIYFNTKVIMSTPEFIIVASSLIITLTIVCYVLCSRKVGKDLSNNLYFDQYQLSIVNTLSNKNILNIKKSMLDIESTYSKFGLYVLAENVVYNFKYSCMYNNHNINFACRNAYDITYDKNDVKEIRTREKVFIAIFNDESTNIPNFVLKRNHYENGVLNEKVGEKKNDIYNEINLESIDFEKKFVLLSDDEIKSRVIFNSNMMLELLNIMNEIPFFNSIESNNNKIIIKFNVNIEFLPEPNKSY